VEDDIQKVLKNVNELSGIKESDTGLAPPALWDLAADKQTLQSKMFVVSQICCLILDFHCIVRAFFIKIADLRRFKKILPPCFAWINFVSVF
jgi:26S proteasome regulatory subunit T1